MLHGEIYEDGDKLASWSAEDELVGPVDVRWHFKVNLTKAGQSFEAHMVLNKGTDQFWVVYYLWNNLVNSVSSFQKQWAESHAPR